MSPRSVPSPEKLIKIKDLELQFFEGSVPSCRPHSVGYTRAHPVLPSGQKTLSGHPVPHIAPNDPNPRCTWNPRMGGGGQELTPKPPIMSYEFGSHSCKTNQTKADHELVRDKGVGISVNSECVFPGKDKDNSPTPPICEIAPTFVKFSCRERGNRETIFEAPKCL